MPLSVVFLRPQNRSRLKPYYQSTITAFKVVAEKCLTTNFGPFGAAFPEERVRQEKRAQRLTLWVQRPPGGVVKRWWPKSSCPPKACYPWVSKRGIWDVPEFCRDVPDPWECSKSLCKRSSCAFFVLWKEGKQILPNIFLSKFLRWLHDLVAHSTAICDSTAAIPV